MEGVEQQPKRKVSDVDTKEIFIINSNLNKEERSLIEKSYTFAKTAHQDQKRNSGEPYFNHLFATAKNIAELGMDGVTIASGFLHDVLEDTETSAEQIEKEFGKEVRFIVEGVTKIGSLRYHGADRHNEPLRKLLLATSEDIRVIIVKLCDRLHNMRTLEFVPKEKQNRIARETLEIYAPIAYRLGIRKLSRELEDLSFPFVNKEGFEEITSLTKEKEKERLESLEKFRKSVVKELAKVNFLDFKIDYRIKGLYSLYKKYIRNKKDFESIHDILAMRITVKEQADCYKLLGIIHSNWKPMPGRIKDYIAFPKMNGYKSLHTTVFTGNGDVVEVQIRTEDMHKEAEYGITSHALYKAEDKDKKQVSYWIKNIIGRDLKDIKQELLSEKIFVFTPKGDVVELPKGSSTIDFAYSIHSDIGDHLAGARINNKMSSLDTLLKNGDIVEIITNKNSKPKLKWLEYIKTSLARRRVRNSSQNNNQSN